MMAIKLSLETHRAIYGFIRRMQMVRLCSQHKQYPGATRKEPTLTETSEYNEDEYEIIEQPSLIYAEPAQIEVNFSLLASDEENKSEDKDKNVQDDDVTAPFVSVEQRLIDIVDKKLNVYLRKIDGRPVGQKKFNLDLDDTYVTCSQKVPPDAIPESFQQNMEQSQDVKYAEFKNVEIPSYLVQKMLEIDMNKTKTLEPAKGEIRNSRRFIRQLFQTSEPDTCKDDNKPAKPKKRTVDETFDQKITVFKSETDPP